MTENEQRVCRNPRMIAKDVKDAARAEIDRRAAGLIALSRKLHAHPETGFEEVCACESLTGELAGHGFEVASGVCEPPTAWIATAGDGPLTIGICAEYDALPGIGHACGHNIIAAAALGGGGQVAGEPTSTVRSL